MAVVHALERRPARAAPAPAPSRSHLRYERPVVALLGLPFDAIGLHAAVETVRAAAFARRRCFVSTPNLNFLVAARRDPAFRDSVLRSDLSLVDGMPLVWMARGLGLPVRERVAGASLFDALCRHPGRPLTVFFFGGPAGVARAAAAALNAKAGGLRCVGFDEAGFGSIDEMSDAPRLARINASGADFVVVSLGAQKGQAWIERNADALDAPLLCHLGAVVNFVAGRVARAPAWLQRIGAEWVWRIVQEPALWRRYAGDAMALLRLFATRVLPLVASPTGPARERSARAVLEVDRSAPAHRTLRLRGAWVASTLAPLRSALGEAAEQARSVHLDLGGVTRIDAACVGLLLLARGDLDRHLVLHDVPARIATALRRHGAEFLLDATAA